MQHHKVLVTGAGGFVGSHLVEHLLDNGYDVRCFTRYTSRAHHGWLDNLPLQKREMIEIVAGDLRDADMIDKVMSDIETVFHLGALVGIPYSYDHPREVVEVNLLGTLNILSAALKQHQCRVIYTSTSEIYGTARYIPIDEEHILQAQSPYAASKIGAEKLVESFYSSYNLPAVILRPFNIYGPRQSARAVIPTIITQIMNDLEIRLGNIDVTRDFTYVSDTVEAFRRAAESQEAIGRTLNVGSNSEISIASLVHNIAQILNKSPNIIQDKVRVRPEKSEVRQLCANNTLAQHIFGWRPTVSISDGLTRTINWIQQNIEYYRIGKYEI